MDLELTAKRVIVTGASRGIGRAIALGFAREQARVALVARNRRDLDEVSAAVRALGAEAFPIVADVSSAAGAEAAVSEARQGLGGLDVLVNNVGGSLGSQSFDKADEDGWRSVLDTNLMSAVHVSRHVVPELKKAGGGAIIHISSICGREYCSSAPYIAAKTALTGLTKEMGISLAQHRIRVVAVAPGSVMFPGGSWDKRRLSNPERIEKMLAEELPWRRFGTPEEVADSVVFLASARASWITGSTVVVDGAQGRAF